MSNVKLKAPEGAENLRGLEVEIKDGFIEVPEAEAPRYFQLGFHRLEAETKPTPKQSASQGS